MTEMASVFTGVVGNTNTPNQSCAESVDQDDPNANYTFTVEPITSVPNMSDSAKAAPSLPTLMQTPSMTGPAATRPRQATHSPMSGNDAPIAD